MNLSISGVSVTKDGEFYTISATAKISQNKKVIQEYQVSARGKGGERGKLVDKLSGAVNARWDDFQECERIRKSTVLTDAIKSVVAKSTAHINGGA